ncbi:unnamed protein product [Arabidopsis halleri]
MHVCVETVPEPNRLETAPVLAPAPEDDDSVILEMITDSSEVVMVEDYITISLDSHHSRSPDSPLVSSLVFGDSVLDEPQEPEWDDFDFPSSPFASPLLPSLTTPSYSPISAMWREPTPEEGPWSISRGVAFGHDRLDGRISALSDHETYCFMCGQVGHYPGSCMYYRPYMPSGTVYLTYGEHGHYATSRPTTRSGASVGGSSFFPGAMSDGVSSSHTRSGTCLRDHIMFLECPCARYTVRRAFG